MATPPSPAEPHPDAKPHPATELKPRPDQRNWPDQRSQRRPRLQFSVLALLVLMLFGSMVGAIGFYFVRGVQSGEQSDKLVGMVFVLAGPLLLMIVVSLMVAMVQRLGRK